MLDRLSSTDEAFLAVEERTMGMHVGAVLVLEGAGLVRPDGSVAIERVRARVRAGIAGERRFAQRLCTVRGLGTVWIDARGFDPDEHVVHTALPRPGGRAELMRLAGRLFAQPLDRRRPLWELWVVEGLEAGRLAVIVKAHHAMIDGVAGLGALASILSITPSEDEPAERPPLDTPPPLAGRLSPFPSRRELAVELARERAADVSRSLKLLRKRAETPEQGWAELRRATTGMLATLRDGLVPASRTSINPPELGLRRGFAGVRFDLERVKHVKRALGGTVNDVVLTTVTGALRRYLARRGDDVDHITRFRALVPVNMRPRTGAAGSMGNHVSLVLAPLPIHARDVAARHAAVREATEHLKNASHEIEGAALIERLGDVALPGLVSSIFRTAMRLRAFNVTVTNMAGPSMPLYLGPARITELYALVPLFSHQGVGLAIVSYDGGLFVGVHTDPDAVPDGDEVGRDLVAAFEELEAHAAAVSAQPAPAQETERAREVRPT